jgi:hypothetical protein
LQTALLRFSRAEQSFYDHILEKTAAASQELQQRRDEQQREQEQQQQQRDAAGSSSAAAAAATGGSHQQQQQQRKRGGGKRKGAGDLDKQMQQLAGTQLLQLRLACLHPQLTRYHHMCCITSMIWCIACIAAQHMSALSVQNTPRHYSTVTQLFQGPCFAASGGHHARVPLRPDPLLCRHCCPPCLFACCCVTCRAMLCSHALLCAVPYCCVQLLA